MLPSLECSATIPKGSGDDAFIAVLDKISRLNQNDFPEYATSLGQDIGANAAQRHRLNDRSSAALARKLAKSKAAIAALEAVDPRQLSPHLARYREIYLHDERLQTVGLERFGVDNPQDPFVITPRDGAYCTLPDFLNTKHKIRTREDAEAYLDRVRAFATALDQDSERQAGAARRRCLPPAFVLDTTLSQMAALRAPAPADSTLTHSIVRRTVDRIPGDWRTRCAAIVERDVYPALDRQIALIRRLRAGARMSAGVWDIPDGAALYAAALEYATTTSIDADAIHRLGLTQMAEIGAQIEGPLTAQGLTRGSVGQRLLELARRPDLLYQDTAEGRAELLRHVNELADTMQPRLSKLFDTPPALPLRVEAAAAEVEEGASDANYFAASADGSVPARLRVNLKALAGSPRWALPALVYHESMPGHHLQKCYARFGMGFRFNAYSEGWALYAEQLADDLGAYATPLDRIGYLRSRLFRAARLVVDTGIHSQRWSRERAINYLVAETGTPMASSQREVDRYCTRPGQACSYMVGYLTWQRALDSARHSLGPKRSGTLLADILRGGEMPLPILERTIRERVKAMT